MQTHPPPRKTNGLINNIYTPLMTMKSLLMALSVNIFRKTAALKVNRDHSDGARRSLQRSGK